MRSPNKAEEEGIETMVCTWLGKHWRTMALSGWIDGSLQTGIDAAQAVVNRLAKQTDDIF